MTLEVLASGRSAAESLMSDTCKVTRATGRTVQDETTGRQVEVRATVHGSVPCKVQSQVRLNSLTPEAGGRVVTVSRLQVHIPLSFAVLPDDRAEITAAGPGSDPELVGDKYRIVAPARKSFATAQRLDAELVE